MEVARLKQSTSGVLLHGNPNGLFKMNINSNIILMMFMYVFFYECCFTRKMLLMCSLLVSEPHMMSLQGEV